MTITRNSRFNHAARIRIITGDGQLVEKEHLDIRPRLSAIDSDENFEVFPSKADTWSRISWRHLGNGRNYWIIADHTGIVDPFSELKPKIEFKYVTQLAVDLSSGTQTSMTVNDPEKLSRGLKVHVEDLDPASPISAEIGILSVNNDTGVVLFSPVTITAPGIPAALSRVSLQVTKPARLISPPANKAIFESLNFNNPLSAFVE